MASIDQDIAPARTDRYTLDGDEAVEDRIDKDQKIIAKAVVAAVPPAHFRALVLMGGYGRGEGGFTLIDGQPAPYNDYDYFIVVADMDKTAIRDLAPRLARIGKDLESEVGVEVDFAFLQAEKLPQAEYSLMHAEMIWGHRVVAGDCDVLKPMPAMPFATLPLGEFTRLMLNRGSLLLINAQQLREGEITDPALRERFVKYMFKALLACTDAVLAAEGRFHPSYPIKNERLATSRWTRRDELLGQYQLALKAKFHPDYREHIKADLGEWQTRTVSLWSDAMRLLETRRLGLEIGDWSDYLNAGISKGQGQPGIKGIARNLAVTARDYGLPQILANPCWSRRYPRERLISTLPTLLTGASPTAALRRALAVGADADWATATKAYLQQWARYA
ncbi:MAG: hypothetical protein H6981_07670 [Gammaproteobacteria bacterium]|nr:hypothetical protein [Gammaproteobacteria bacterium]MCP5136662.1 hypothetical protein [Gammaproteobacteria bacterium]